MSALDDDLMPPSATPFERNASKAAARVFAVDTGAVRRERRADLCDAAFLPLLGWETSIHFWSPTDAAGNAARVASSFGDHVAYGSPAALEAEIAQDTGQDVRVREAFQEASLTWPAFVVETTMTPGGPIPDLDGLLASALRRKNVRDMPRIRLATPQPAAHFFVGAASTVHIRVRNAVPTPIAAYVGAAARLLLTTKVNPQ